MQSRFLRISTESERKRDGCVSTLWPAGALKHRSWSRTLKMQPQSLSLSLAFLHRVSQCAARLRRAPAYSATQYPTSDPSNSFLEPPIPSPPTYTHLHKHTRTGSLDEAKTLLFSIALDVHSEVHVTSGTKLFTLVGVKNACAYASVMGIHCVCAFYMSLGFRPGNMPHKLEEH